MLLPCNNLLSPLGMTRRAQAATGVESEWCLSFDGVNDCVTSDPGLSLQSHTISCWVRTTSTALNVGFASLYQSSGTKISQVGLKAGGKLWMQVYSGGNQKNFISDALINDGLWHHVVGVFDRSGDTIRLFIDGALASSTAPQDQSLSTFSFSPGSLKVGTEWSGTIFVVGLIDDVRVYSRALSATEIEDLYNGEHITDGLTAYLDMEEGTGTTTVVKDGTGATIATATLTGGPTWHPQTPPALVSGRETLEYSASFDGVNDYIDLGTTDWLSGTAASFSLWCKHTSASGTHRLFAKEPLDYLTSFSFYGNTHFFTSKTSGGQVYADAFTGGIGVNNGIWHNFVATVDSSQIKLYFDGMLMSAAAWSHGILASTARTILGASYYAGSVQFFYSGTLSDVRGYASTLSTADVQKLARGQVVANPVGRWKLDEPSGDTVIDYGSGGNDGTRVNGVGFSTDVPPWLSAA